MRRAVVRLAQEMRSCGLTRASVAINLTNAAPVINQISSRQLGARSGAGEIMEFVQINYGLQPGVELPDEVQDCIERRHDMFLEDFIYVCFAQALLAVGAQDN
ncbi:MAG: hypothetical protein ACYCOU_07025 [Sulfobacillus sp.]